MKKAILTFDISDDFEYGECKKCPFLKGNNQCLIEECLTNGSCSLNCFCRLKIYTQKQIEDANAALAKGFPKRPLEYSPYGIWKEKVCPNPRCGKKLYDTEWTEENKKKHHLQICIYCGQKLTKPCEQLGEWENK